MGKFKSIRVLLVIAGSIGICIGGAQLLIPVTFESFAGINLGENSSLFSEIRAAGGALLIAGIVILSGVFISGMTYISIVLSTLFYLSYGLSRVLSMIIDGIPSESLVIATVAEIIIGIISLFVLYRFGKEQQIKAVV